MPAVGRPIRGDIGSVVSLNLGTHVSGYQTVYFKVKKPNAQTTTWSGIVISVLSGIVEYTVASGDFNVAGVYTLYPEVTYGDGKFLQGMAATFEVYEPFD